MPYAPLFGAPNVEVVLRHFHRHYPRAAHCGSLLKGLRSLELTAMDGHKDLRGLERRSIIHYVHREDYCIAVCSSS
jgi:hypothetical protein